MNEKFTWFAALILIASPLRAKPLTGEIRGHCHTIDANLRRYTHVKRDVMGLSAEGGELQAYVARSGPRKVCATLYSEQWQAHQTYYFWNRRLIFVDIVTLRYLSPEEASKDSTREEQRFYFESGRLMRWVDGKGKVVTDKARISRQQCLLVQGANEWLNRAKASRRK